MPRWARERIGGFACFGDVIGSRDRGLGRPIGGVIRIGSDRASGIGLMIACLADCGERVAICAVGGVDIGDDLFSCALDTAPAGVDILQKSQVLWRVHCSYRADACVERSFERTACGEGASMKARDALRLFWIGRERTIGHEMLGIMRGLAGVKEGFHCGSFCVWRERAARGAPERVRPVSPRRGAKPRRA